MPSRRRTWRFGMQSAGSAEEAYGIRGIVEDVSENALTLKNKLDGVSEVYDITEVPVFDMSEKMVMERGSALRGEIADIYYRNGKVAFVKIFSPVPE